MVQPCLEGALVKKKGMLFLPLLAVAGLLVFGGCVGDSIEPVRAQGSVPTATPTPSPTPSAEPEALLQPTPTPTPVPPQIPRAEAEAAVLEAISSCTDGVATVDEMGVGGTIRLFLDSTFSQTTRAWVIQVDTADFAVTFGTWRIAEGSVFKAQPVDRIAERIAAGDMACKYPTVLLEADSAPPRFVHADNIAASGAIINNSSYASMRVWSSIYDCSQDFPELANFVAYQYVNSTWMVEGKTADTQYGLWQVNAITGDVEPIDDHARRVVESCDATPIVMTASQAEIRVWVATYGCYPSPAPELAVYQAAQESSHRWVVEGRRATAGSGAVATYGLWLVETDSGEITGLDAYARNMRAQACFQAFE